MYQRHTLGHIDKALANMKDKNKKIIIEYCTMVGCINTEPRHMYQRNTKSHIDKAY